MTELISKESVLQVIKDRIESIEEAFGISHYERSMKSDYLLDILCDLECIKPVNQWISVKDRLPERRVQVLVTDGYDMDTGNLSVDGWWHLDDSISCDCLGDITHWQPLPEPPKED